MAQAKTFIKPNTAPWRSVGSYFGAVGGEGA
jgi:hypothetical protein